MEVILDRNGNVIQRSQNLAGIRRYVGKRGGPAIKILSIGAIGKYAETRPDIAEGKLCILFVDGSSFETNFASYTVLKDFVRRWRNVYGAPLVVEGADCGTVRYHNPALIGTE